MYREKTKGKKRKKGRRRKKVARRKNPLLGDGTRTVIFNGDYTYKTICARYSDKPTAGLSSRCNIEKSSRSALWARIESRVWEERKLFYKQANVNHEEARKWPISREAPRATPRTTYVRAQHSRACTYAHTNVHVCAHINMRPLTQRESAGVS